MVVGASRPTLLRQVIAEEARPVVLGLLTGLVAILALGRALSSFLYEVSPADTAHTVRDDGRTRTGRTRFYALGSPSRVGPRPHGGHPATVGFGGAVAWGRGL